MDGERLVGNIDVERDLDHLHDEEGQSANSCLGSQQYASLCIDADQVVVGVRSELAKRIGLVLVSSSRQTADAKCPSPDEGVAAHELQPERGQQRSRVDKRRRRPKSELVVGGAAVRHAAGIR
jgi:hypothetical protein